MNAKTVGRVRIFDTTLRDGEQSPGVSLSPTEKAEIARWLVQMGVDVIEAGFPAASREDRLSVELVARAVGRAVGERTPTICALARATDADIDAAWEAIQLAENPCIHTFLAASDIHLKHKLRITRQRAIERAYAAVTRAKSYCDCVQFSPEDASRADPDFLCQMVAVAVDAGATTINIPDTVGYSTPDEFGRLIQRIVRSVPSDGSIVISVHCHNDLGMATANTLAGLRAGARQAEVTMNGIGERAGNTALEEVVMSLATRHELYHLTTQIDTTRIARASRMVSHYTGLPVQPNKAIVGANAFAHESGIHQDGVLKHQATYEIMRPETIGLIDSNLVLGKHSGRHAFAEQIDKLGYQMNEAQLEEAFHRFKELASKKRTVGDADIEALIADLVHRSDDGYRLVDLQVVAGRPGLSTATARLLGPKQEELINASVGTGPVDAIYRAINAIVQIPNRLEEFRIHAITEGIDAQGAVSVRIRGNGGPMRVGGYGTDTDILVASAQAYISALNRLVERQASASENGVERDPNHAREAKETRMNNQDEKVRSDTETETIPDCAEMQDDPSQYEAPEIRGWALQWDTTELRKMNMARKMRNLRQSPTAK